MFNGIIGIVMFAGWITNIVNVVNSPNTLQNFTGYELVELVGIFIMPMGSFLGMYSWF
jgi:hypothetical protein